MEARARGRWWRAGAVLGVVLVCAAAVSLFRSLPKGDVDPFGAVLGALGVLLAGAGLAIPVRQYLRERESGAEGLLAQAVRAHERSQYDNILGPSRVVMPVRFRLTPPPGGPDEGPVAAVEAEWERIADRYLELPDSGGRRLAVTGGPGSGKSLLARALTLELAARHAEGGCGVPVLLPLSSWSAPLEEMGPADEEFHRAFRGWLVEQISGTYGRSPRLVERVLDDAVLVLDGLDELDGRDDTIRPRARALLAYLRGNRRRPGNVIVTCRTHVYESFGAPVPLAGAARAELLDVPADTALAYLRRQSAWLDGGSTDRWAPLLEDLRTAPDAPLARELNTPWRLTVLAHAYHAPTDEARDPAELVSRWGHRALLRRFEAEYAAREWWWQWEWDRLPVDERLARAADSPLASDMRSEAEEYLMALYVPSALASHPRPRRRYDAERVHSWLALLARHREIDGYRQARRTPSLHTLSVTRADLAPHRLWPLGGRRLVRAVDAALASAVALSVTGLALATVGVSADLALCGLLILATSLPAAEAWRHDLFRSGIRHVSTSGRFLGIPERHLAGTHRLSFGAFAGGSYGLAVGYHLVGVEVSSPADLPPSVWAAAAVGAVLAVPLAGLVSVETWSTVKGGAHGRRHRVFLVCAALRRRLPLRLGWFLDWAHEGGLLRVDGTSYRFRHDEFEQYLWRRYWRPRLVPAAVDAARRTLQDGDEAPDRGVAARRIRRGVRDFAERRADLFLICPDSVARAARAAEEELTAWAARLDSDAGASEVAGQRRRARQAVRRFREAAEGAR
ncbi:NACHT domain-containing protein [Streptomyces sp. B93]|uniref:NACHT domain-containing protein n=1 Tax=Streptomyces sp. B93 TaxID=2824875 RepID=UPI001B385EB4|nr:NACHT domain-containing protein [Streptomyces sp. B93]MBQ1089717.1 NACHT domain-containing protein [Streptomyces sp. B93]